MMRLIVVLVVCASVGVAVADPFSFYGKTVDVEYWAGSGSGADNLAVFVLDFENASGSYAFGYGWDGVDPVVEFDLLNAVDAAGSFSLTSHFDAGFSQNVVDTLSYAGDTIGDAPYPEDYPYSFSSADGVNWNELFTGVDTTLVNAGDYIGWSAQNERWVEAEPGVWVPPNYNTPNTPVPEPTTVSLFVFGAALAAWRKRRKV